MTKQKQPQTRNSNDRRVLEKLSASNSLNNKELIYVARRIRELILYTTFKAEAGHTGGSLSEVEILTLLFFKHMHIDPSKPHMKERDRFILSKGHSTPGYYATLAYRGFFDLTILSSFDSLGSILQAHPDMHKVPGCDISTGSLGQGLSCGIGMALGAQKAGIENKVFVLIGDGESTEGQIWEAILYAGAQNIRVKNLIAIIDNNRVQLASHTNEAVDLGNLAKKYESFGWTAISCDGHNIEELDEAFTRASTLSEQGPVVIIANTVKGKGISFMEDTCTWHGKAANKEEYIQAMNELYREESTHEIS